MKWLEAAGARVVPINYLASKNDLIKIMDSINGVLFTGGGIEDFQNNPFWIVSIKYRSLFEKLQRMKNVFLLEKKLMCIY